MLKTVGVKEGDYIICQSFSFVATANPIIYSGGIPVFIDSEADTWNMDPKLLEEAILDLRKSDIRPKAIIYAHIYGNPAKVEELASISAKYDIPLIEDAAEALGTTINSKSVGKFGKISIFSFNGNKIVTTAGGGALLTDDPEIAYKSLHLATQARNMEKTYLHTEVGYNYRMSNLSAALGLAQINYLEKWIGRKRSIFQIYKELDNRDFSFGWIEDHSAAFLNRWLSAFLVDPPHYVKRIEQTLHRHGIESRRFWKPLHAQDIYRRQKAYVSGVALELFEKGICLPCGVGLTNVEINEIINILKGLD